MLTPILRFDLPESDLFHRLLERHTVTALDFTQFDYGAPVALDRSRTEVEVVSSPESDFTGGVIVRYDRLDIGRFFWGCYVTLTGLTEIDSETLHAAILAQWGVYIDPAHIRYTIREAGPELPRVVDLDIADGSYVWYGRLRVWVLPQNLLSDTLSAHPLGTGFPEGPRTNAYFYSLHTLTPLEDPSLVSTFTVDQVLSTQTVELNQLLYWLQTTTGDTWLYSDTVLDYTLTGAHVLFNGPYTEDDPSSCIFALHLSPLCHKLVGTLAIRYTCPDSPEV